MSRTCIKLRHLEQILQQLEGFEKPKIFLEQYITPPHLASHMLYTIESQFGDIGEKCVADLGCGCGALTIGAAVLNAGVVIGFDIDDDALDVLNQNVREQEVTNIDAIRCNVIDLDDRWNKLFDTVVMNPPFGTKKNVGIDMQFLVKAFQLSKGVVYSLHKTSTRAHVIKVAKSNGYTGNVIAVLRYNLPATYKFHKKTSVDIEVDLFRFTIDL